MSVPKSLRKEGKLEAQTLAYAFAAHTDRICSNERCFQKRNRWCTTTEIVQMGHKIAIAIDMANVTRLENPRRLELQNEALEATYAIETLMEIAYRENLNSEGNPTIPDEKIEYWVKLLLALRSKIRRWRDGDKKRLKAKEEGEQPSVSA